MERYYTDDIKKEDWDSIFECMVQNYGYRSGVMRREVVQQMNKLLPSQVQRRVKALKNLQLDHLKLEAKFYEEMYQTEKKYVELYKPILEKRSKIIAGDVDPTDEEARYQLKETNEVWALSDRLRKATLEIKKDMEKYPKDLSGIPDFWLTVFKTSTLIADMIQPHDQPILKELRDIKVVHDTDGMIFTLEFHFAPNEHFKDTVLTKKYFMHSELDKEDPFNFQGPEIYKCTGCVINWLPGKNVTVKDIKKKQRNGGSGGFHTTTKEIHVDSFFNFFNPPVWNEDAVLGDEALGILASDYEIGHYFRTHIIPKAVLFFTGDYVDEENDSGADDSDGSDEDPGEESEKSDEVEPSPKKPIGSVKKESNSE